MRAARIPLWLGAFLLAVGAEWSAYDWSDVRHWLPDLVAGSALISCGLVGWSRRPESRSGGLMAAAGVAWFLPNFATTGVSAVDWTFEHLLYAHRGPLLALVVTYPLGRLRGRLDAAVVLAGCVLALLTPVWQSELASIGVALALLAVAARGYVAAVGRQRRLRQAALGATAALATLFAGVALAHLVASGAARGAILLAYQLSLVALATALLTALIQEPWEPRRVGDLVVELGETRSGTLRDALARALGDPELEVGYWSPAASAYIDAEGAALEPAAPAGGRSATRIDRDGEPVAVLIHDRAVLDDRGLLEAIGEASALAAANARLQAEVREQIGALEASRRRLLDAADQERRRLEQRLHGGAERRLTALRPVFERAAATVAAESEAAVRVERAGAQLERTLDELRQLARGLHPRALVENGLATALRGLAAESPTPVDLSLPDRPLPQGLESAVYFVCAEALTNAAKYATAARVSVRVSIVDGAVVAEVTDDGVGGADPAQGSGLSGLADRVEALGGRLRVTSPPGGGTRVSAEIPLRA
jgi:signal transduction histidine kinase